MTALRIPGEIGLPPDTKRTGKIAEFKAINSLLDSNFDILIETLTPRLGWARGVQCPCVGFNDQTMQVDPQCSTCNGKGFRFFKPSDYVADEEAIGTLSGLQTKLLNDSNAVVIRGYLSGIGTQPSMYEVLGAWALGSAMLTTRSNNLLGYQDRIIQLDGRRPHGEVVETDGSGTTKLWYPALSINFIGSLTTTYTLCTTDNPTGDYQIVNGDIVWETGKEPTTGTRLSVHYEHHPVWCVQEQMKLNRQSLVTKNQANLETPQGNLIQLPGQVLVRLEHLPQFPSS